MKELREIPKHDKKASWLYKFGKKDTLFKSGEIEAAKKDGWVDSPAKAIKPKPKTKPRVKKVTDASKVISDNESLLDED